MININGTLISLTRTQSAYSANPYNQLYAAWTTTEINNVCNAIKTLLTSNVNSITEVYNATNNHVLSHAGMEAGHAIQISGYVGNTTSPSYVTVSEGTWSGSTFTPLISYSIYPYISGLSTISSSGYGGTLTWSWSYSYRLLVDDEGKSFVLRISQNGSGSSTPFSSTTSNSHRYMANTSNYRYQIHAFVFASTLLISILPINNVYYLTYFSPKNNSWQNYGLGNALIDNGQGSAVWYTKVGPQYPGPLYTGWLIQNYKYYIASTMTPSVTSSDYGHIKVVKLGVCEGGLPYIVDNLFVDNLAICEINSNLLDGQIIVIDGYKYIYSNQGYLFRLGVA